MYTLRAVISAMLLFFALHCDTVAQEPHELTIPLLTYHNKPPFVVNQEIEQGLYYDLARLLSQQHPRFNFTLLVVPRKRLDHMLDTNTLQGVVIGVSPPWFGDPDESQYLWMDTLVEDRDEFVSLATSPFEYRSVASFNGKVVAAVSGLFYKGINKAVKDGRLLRINTVSEEAVLSLVSKQRADFGIVSLSMLRYLQRHGGLGDDYYISVRPHDIFSRRAFTLSSNRQVYDIVAPLIEQLYSSPEWQRLLNDYK